jgi:formamidopyrimidine-DNA glycosylase
MKLLPTSEIVNIPFFVKVGPEPLKDAFTFEDFIDRFKRKKRSVIKAALLDQTVIAGVGNIYADESLWRAQIHPETRVEALDKSDFERLYEAVRYVMNLSIEKGGSTARNYVNADGGKGNYLDYANVFRKEGTLCVRCGAEIIKTRVAGRGTHICPVCQKIKV